MCIGTSQFQMSTQHAIRQFVVTNLQFLLGFSESPSFTESARGGFSWLRNDRFPERKSICSEIILKWA
jgi:hypothetical protein